MKRFLKNRLFLQLLFTLIAAVSLAALSVVLISEAIRSAESVVLGEANKTISSAIHELKQQYQYRVSSDSEWQTLPARALDVSLRGISQTVLRSYPGVEGGFYSGSCFFGYSYPTHDTGAAKTDVPGAERDLIVDLARQSLHAGQSITKVVRGRADLLVLGAIANKNHTTVAWAMKRLVGQAAPGARERELLLSILVLAALVSISGTLATGLSLARGIAQIKNGLSGLEHDFAFLLPERSDELGGIIHSINRMAAVRRKLESELRREDRLRAVGRLAAGLAHEIRNPLNSISLTVQLLERKWERNTIRREDLRIVRNEVDRLNTLLTDLLDLQRSHKPHPEVQLILPIVQHCISLVERQAQMQNTLIRLESPQDEPCGLCDSRQLTQTVVNLLLNALEVSPPGAPVWVRVQPANGTTRVEVEDQGPGLDAEQQEHLFEPFFTTKVAGTGLGLAVSRELMRGQGGDLHYFASPKGARFIVELPQN